MSDWGNKESIGGKAGSQGGKRNSGAFWGPDFDGLYMQKRSSDAESSARRYSIADQYKTGFAGRMWSKYVSGPNGPTEGGK